MNKVFFISKLLISLAIIGTLFGVLGVILAISKSELAMIPVIICAIMPIIFLHYYDSEEKKYYDKYK
ncbi:hypothetical protein [Macrococcus sp. DPC7161]|uniref:hypothetical protein n=1 Tax=Macrococcus sp. DPC7161 TaxID=2507060 RepID=UPI00100B5BA9|nr:hypothetical protein [Macrococcus sp. DPC7161]RXK18931.1 hypothetical protein ER639_01075 [Macrococcus sp. DPC7161]